MWKYALNAPCAAEGEGRAGVPLEERRVLDGIEDVEVGEGAEDEEKDNRLNGGVRGLDSQRLQ